MMKYVDPNIDWKSRGPKGGALDKRVNTVTANMKKAVAGFNEAKRELLKSQGVKIKESDLIQFEDTKGKGGRSGIIAGLRRTVQKLRNEAKYATTESIKTLSQRINADIKKSAEVTQASFDRVSFIVSKEKDRLELNFRELRETQIRLIEENKKLGKQALDTAKFELSGADISNKQAGRQKLNALSRQINAIKKENERAEAEKQRQINKAQKDQEKLERLEKEHFDRLNKQREAENQRIARAQERYEAREEKRIAKEEERKEKELQREFARRERQEEKIRAAAVRAEAAEQKRLAAEERRREAAEARRIAFEERQAERARKAAAKLAAREQEALKNSMTEIQTKGTYRRRQFTDPNIDQQLKAEQKKEFDSNMKIYEDRKNRLTQKIQDIQDLGGKKFRLPAFTATSVSKDKQGSMDKALLDLEQELDDDLLRLKAIEKKAEDEIQKFGRFNRAGVPMKMRNMDKLVQAEKDAQDKLLGGIKTTIDNAVGQLDYVTSDYVSRRDKFLRNLTLAVQRGGSKVEAAGGADQYVREMIDAEVESIRKASARGYEKTQKDLDKFHRDQLAQQEKRDKQALAMRKARTQIAENGLSVKEGSLLIKLPD